MLEIMIERWSLLGGRIEFRWSVWQDGRRIEMGARPNSTSEDAEAAARAWCREVGLEPDRISQL
jgi:hypothetical protein